MCVIFPVEIDVSQTVIKDCQVNKQTRELVYINKIMNIELTKPVLMMFNISGPIKSVTRKNNNLRDEIKSEIDKQFDQLERDHSTQFDGGHCIKYFKDEHYSISCQSGNVLKSKFEKILKSHGYTDEKSIEAYKKYCLPKLVDEQNNYYVAVCVLKPGFEKGSNQVLSFEYNPIGNKVIVPFAHEINDTGLYEYDAAAYVDNVKFDGEQQFEKFVQSLTLPSAYDDEEVLYYNETSENKRMMYKALEFKTKSCWGKFEWDYWKIFCNGFIYDEKLKVLYVKLHNVTSRVNNNIILNID
ncbi:P35 [Maruca vitrata nucleopolyhedrovirus]|uniref:p35 n=1 Tax=Maruca vitrata nucleopolyhedrovirus TaxID=1307954 RepID=A1YRG5_9ABAC|nr:P35 [Maruca vitrata nucleopolyhedrovirus]ABM05419.1 P35 [Maruca vitrata nucleopolyhedrovirus]